MMKGALMTENTLMPEGEGMTEGTGMTVARESHVNFCNVTDRMKWLREYL